MFANLPRVVTTIAAAQESLKIVGCGWIDAPSATWRATLLPVDYPDMPQCLFLERVNRVVHSVADHYGQFARAYAIEDDGFSIIFVDNPSEVQLQ